MNSSNVIEIVPKTETGQVQLLMGLLPCMNQFLLNAVAPVILPGIKELAEMSLGEFTPYQVMNDILYGSKQLYMGYADHAGIESAQFQETFAKKLQEPSKDYVGFSIIEPLRNAGFHIFAVYIMPEFRETNMMQIGLAYLEKEARKMGSPSISLATRHDVSGALARLGFSETTSNYRKTLPKE